MDHLGLGALAFLGKILAGSGIGFAIGLTGIGGGVLVMPVLTAVLGLPPILAVGTSNIFNLLARSYAFTEHLRLKIIRFKEAFQFLGGALPASLAGALGLNLILRSGSLGPEGQHALQEGLRYAIAVAIVLSLAILLITFALEKKMGLRQTPLSSLRGSNAKKNSHHKSPGAAFASRFFRPWMGVLSGVFVGLLMGLTGIGGGVMVVPILIVFFRLDIRETVGTSGFIALVIMLVNSVVYGLSAQIEWMTAFGLFLGSVPGIIYGSRMAVRIPEKTLRRTIVGVIVLATVAMFIRSSRG